MLLSAQGAPMAETRLDGVVVVGQPKAHSDEEYAALLRDEALMSGFTAEEVEAADIVIVGDFG